MKKRQPFSLGVLILFTLINVFPYAAASAQNNSGAMLDGFPSDESNVQRQLEGKFAAIPDAARAREHLRRLTAAPHVAGTNEDYQTALYVRDGWRAAGLQAELKEYQVMLAEPKRPSVLEIIRGGRRERLSLQEAAVQEDGTSSHPGIIPLFNAYGASGDVTAP
ncbi:MAG TPA: hypothetical protein VM870_11295, partial [Pyrinomonadaceae bacterium]|nr:hypothetical protein [Pyrinomonadaceae bacterium]